MTTLTGVHWITWGFLAAWFQQLRPPLWTGRTRGSHCSQYELAVNAQIGAKAASVVHTGSVPLTSHTAWSGHHDWDPNIAIGWLVRMVTAIRPPGGRPIDAQGSKSGSDRCQHWPSAFDKASSGHLKRSAQPDWSGHIVQNCLGSWIQQLVRLLATSQDASVSPSAVEAVCCKHCRCLLTAPGRHCWQGSECCGMRGCICIWMAIA